MAVPMTAPTLLRALAALGERCPAPTRRIVLAGGSALLLSGQVERTTNDGDVVVATPPLAELAGEIAAVQTDLALPADWLNDRAGRFADFLADDYEARLVPVGRFGRLDAYALGRLDLILMKVLALRAQDQDDLWALAPTDAEWAQVVAQFVRVADRHPRRVVKARLFVTEYRAGRRPRAAGDGPS
jgi:hypothetical protein